MAASVVVVGSSLGGLHALGLLLRGLPAGFPAPIVIVQHRGKDPDDALRRLLSVQSQLPVSEPIDKERVVPGHVYIAPADYHLLLERGSFALSTEAPVHYARPAVDVLFESAAESYGAGVVGVVLTGANHDGAAGAAKIKRYGGRVIVQDPESAESRPMPLAAIAATGVRGTPLKDIPALLISLCAAQPA
jgi:two-component system chemotaxis response regulator CheB